MKTFYEYKGVIFGFNTIYNLFYLYKKWLLATFLHVIDVRGDLGPVQRMSEIG